jgi:hypothetical protein
MDIGFVAYFIEVLSLAVSLYVAYLVIELKNRLPKPTIKRQSSQQTKQPLKKGHWD